jgi:phosphate transport system substrate-binding protein
MKGIRVAKDAADEGVEPSEETVLSKTYPIARPLFLYTAREPEGLAKQFLEFVQSDAGQSLVKEQGYVPTGKKAGAAEGGDGK